MSRKPKTLIEIQEDRRIRNAKRVRDYRAEYRARRAMAIANGYTPSEWINGGIAGLVRRKLI